MTAVSVLIATYNRCADLKLALESLRKQKFSDYEIVIMDNNSNDATKSTVESFFPSFEGRLKYFFEPQQGKPYAINRGLKEVSGNIIVLTDDDCTFEDDYIAEIYKLFQDDTQKIGFIGGRVLPRWVDCSKPAWFIDLKPGWWYKDFFWGPLAILDYGQEPFMLDQKQNPKEKRLFYGANMAVRKECFTRWGGFNPEKHVTEDVEFQLRFLRNGVKGMYTPHIKAYHLVSRGRLTPEYYYRWYYSRGVLLEVEKNFERKFYHPFGVSWSLIGQTINLWIGSLFNFSLAQRVYRRSHALFNVGQMVQIAKKNPLRKSS